MSPASVLALLARCSAQAGVLVVVVLLVQWIFRRQLAPRWRCALWLLLVARLLLPISPASMVSIFNLVSFERFLPGPAPAGPRVPPAGPAAATARVVEPADPAAVERRVVTPPADVDDQLDSPRTAGPARAEPRRMLRSVSWPELILVVWLTGAGGMLAYLGFAALRLARQIGRAARSDHPEVLALLRECRASLGVRTELLVVESTAVSSPALYGVFRPRLLMPHRYVEKFSARELRFIFLHELAHLKRRDLPVGWIMAVLQALHWFNPLVWLGFARWRADRELACDALALENVGAACNREYGETILRLLQHTTGQPATPALVGILEDRGQLRQRIAMIAQFKPAARWSAPALVLVTLIAAGCLTDARRPAAPIPPTVAAPAAPAVPPVAPRGNARPMPRRDLELPMVTLYQAKPFVVNGQAVPYFDSILGRQVIDGLPFEIDGAAVLYGERSARGSARHPTELAAIPVGQKFGELHVIHHAKYSADPDGTTIARLRLNYTDGSSHEFEIGYGVHVRDWLRTPFEGPETLSDANSKVIWRGAGPGDVDAGSLRLFKSLFRNPHPDREVSSISVISARNQSCYSLVAVTIADADSRRPVTPAVALQEPAGKLDSRLVVHVVDAGTGRPVAGARVVATNTRDEWCFRPLSVGADGTVVLTYAKDHTPYLQVAAWKEGYPEKSAEWPGEIPAEVTLALAAGRTLGGQIVDDDGQPLANAGVRLLNLGGTNEAESAAGQAENFYAQSDAAGHWAIEGVPDRITRFGVQVDVQGYPRAYYFASGAKRASTLGETIPAEDFWSGKALLRLQTGQWLEGRVKEDSGAAVVGATLAARELRSGRVLGAARSGPTGKFRLRHLAAGDNLIEVLAPGFAPTYRTVVVKDENEPILFTLSPGRLVQGVVTDGAGQPLSGVTLEYAGQAAEAAGAPSPRPIHFKWSTVTDEHGKFVWEHAPLSGVVVRVSKPGFQAAGHEISGDSAMPVAIVLPLRPEVSGMVTDEAGRPKVL